VKKFIEHIKESQSKIDEAGWRTVAGKAALIGALLTGSPSVADAKPNVQDVKQVDNTVAKVLAGEAAGEGERGMKAVACVVQNRMKGGKTAKQVVTARSQFSAYNDKALMDRNYKQVKSTADSIASQIGSLTDITGGATHYLTTALYNKKKNNKKSWVSKMTVTKVIGNHTFLKE